MQFRISSTGASPGTSNHGDHSFSNLPVQPVSWKMYYSNLNVSPICVIHSFSDDGSASFQCLSINFRAWNKSLPIACLEMSSIGMSSRIPKRQGLGSVEMVTRNTHILSTPDQYRCSFGHLQRRYIRSP